jgi:hypothetical protein
VPQDSRSSSGCRASLGDHAEELEEVLFRIETIVEDGSCSEGVEHTGGRARPFHRNESLHPCWRQAFGSLTTSVGARACHHRHRAMTRLHNSDVIRGQPLTLPLPVADLSDEKENAGSSP